ncbi:MAG TPA: hypothetical protein VF148_13800 [Acidimicrobiia bacterium]
MLFASATPIVPASERYRRLATELDPHLGEYETLNDRYGVRRHVFWVSHARDGSDIGVERLPHLPLRSARDEQGGWDPESAYDAWWLEFVDDVNGVDMAREPAHREPPEQLFA